jgi:hypothetical protein
VLGCAPPPRPCMGGADPTASWTTRNAFHYSPHPLNDAYAAKLVSASLANGDYSRLFPCRGPLNFYAATLRALINNFLKLSCIELDLVDSPKQVLSLKQVLP